MKRTTNRWRSRFVAATVLASVCLLLGADEARAGGTAFTTGKNQAGQLGLGDTKDRDVFLAVTAPKDNVAASCGFSHSIVATRDGFVYTCGLNLDGQLGLGHNLDRPNFMRITTVTKVTDVAGGGAHSLLCTSDGTLYSTGNNGHGQLGLGDVNNRNTFTKVALPSGVVAVAAGEFHSLALDAWGDVWSCGSNSNGQLGYGGGDSDVFWRVPLPPVIAIACGARHSLAIDMFYDLWVWGSNGNGQLGLGDAAVGFNFGPVWNNLVGTVFLIAGGGAHSLVEKTDGHVQGSGFNLNGQLGVGDSLERHVFTDALTSLSPKALLLNADSLGAGKAHSLAVVNGSVYDCGLNGNGQLGLVLGDKKDRSVFAKNNNVFAASIVRGGEYHSCTVSSIPTTVQFETGALSVDESVGTVELVVTLMPPTSKIVTVDYDVTSGTATLGADFIFIKGTLTFNPGQTRRKFSLAITDDNLSEDSETIVLSLLSPANAGVGSPGACGVTIFDNDPLPSVAFALDASKVDENVPDPGIVVQLSDVAGRDISVICKNTGGSAMAGVDYLLNSTRVTIKAGDTTATVPMLIYDNLVSNFDKTVQLTLSSPKNATLGAPSVHTLTIADNEPPLIYFQDPVSLVAEGFTTQTVTVKLSRQYDKQVTVDYKAIGGTALGGGVQYSLVPGLLTFDIGEDTKAFTVDIVDDGKAGPDVTVVIGLSKPTNGVIGIPPTHTLTILDNSDPILDVQSSGVLDFGKVGLGVQKIMKDAYTISNLGGSTLHAKVSIDNPPFQVFQKEKILDSAKNWIGSGADTVPAYTADFAVPSGTSLPVSFSCVPYSLDPKQNTRTITFSDVDDLLTHAKTTTRTATCQAVIQTRITKYPNWVARGGTIYVEWVVEGGKPTHNDVHWGTSPLSQPNKTFQDLTVPYAAWFRAPSIPCTVYLKAHAIILGMNYYSDPTLTKVIVK